MFPSSKWSSTPVTVTVWAVFQVPLVNVSDQGDTVPSAVLLDDRPKLTSAVGCAVSTTVNVAVPPASVVVRPDVPVLSISGDGGFLFTSNELATAMRHRIPLTAVVFNDGAFGNVRRIQEEAYGNRLIACDLANPDFLRYAQSFGAEAERARDPQELRAALKRAFKRRDGPTLIEVPVGPMPSPWEFIHMPPVRGS